MNRLLALGVVCVLLCAPAMAADNIDDSPDPILQTHGTTDAPDPVTIESDKATVVLDDGPPFIAQAAQAVTIGIFDWISCFMKPCSPHCQPNDECRMRNGWAADVQDISE